jgi:acetolactate synthase regulatory subunit
VQDLLNITLVDVPGEFVRVLALIERRRFVIREMKTEVGADPGTTTLHVAVTSEGRNVLSLANQLHNLVGVVDVTHGPPEIDR